MHKKSGAPTKQKQKTRIGEGLLVGIKPDEEIKRGESVCFVKLKLSVGRRTADGRTFGDLRDIGFWLMGGAENRASLAFALMYAWVATTEAKSIKGAVRELVEECTAQGLTSARDLVRELKALDKGGRPKGSVSRDTKQYQNLFIALKQSAPLMSEQAVLTSIAEDTFPGRARTPELLAAHKAKVKRNLQLHGLLPKQTKTKNSSLSRK